MQNKKTILTFFCLVLITISPIKFWAENLDSLNLILKKGSPEQKVDAGISLSNYYFYSKPDSAENYLNQALILAKENNFHKKEEIIYLNIGILYNEKGITSTAEKYFNKALNLSEQENDSSVIIASLGNLGNSAMYSNDYVTALDYFIQILDLYKNQKNNSGIGNTYGAIGNIFANLKKYDKALFYYELANNFFLKAKDTVSTAIITMNEATIYGNKKNLKLAEEKYLKSYKIFKNYDLKLNMAESLEGLAQINASKKNYKKSKEILFETLNIYKKLDAKKNIAASYILLGNISVEQLNHQLAIVFYDSAYQISFKLKNYKQLAKITQKLHECYYDINDFKSAYNYSILNKTYSDSLLNIENMKKLSELETKFETQQKIQQIERLTKANEISEAKHRREKWIISLLLIFVFLLVFIFILLYNRQNLLNKQKQILLEQKLFRLQMNPHFLFNSLIAIQNFMVENNAQQANHYLTNFAKMMRKILENSRKNYISIEEEIEILKYYVDFQKLHTKNDFTFTIEKEEEIDYENTLIPPMLIQPFVENSIKYAFNSKIKNPSIKITMHKEQDIILTEIIDNGIGFEKPLNNKMQKNNHNSLAIDITKDRLKNIYLKKNIIFTIENLNTQNPSLSGTKVIIGIPFKEEY